MNLINLVGRRPSPEPWEEADNIPWHEPEFSQRMLAEHLSQEHDAASRRFETIDRHVEWIHRALLAGDDTTILDLACGPGLYSSRLAKLGHECVGIDYSPASVAFAVDCARQGSLRCTYTHGDIRTTKYGTGYGLAMLLYGELNVFRRSDAKSILEKAHRSLAENGLLLLEPHSFAMMQSLGEESTSWYSAAEGLFSAEPHLCLTESFWNPESGTACRRYYVIDAASGAVTRCAQSFQAYTEQQYRELLEECGFRDIQFYPVLAPSENEPERDLIAITARR